MAKRTTTQILKQLICLAMVAIVLAPIVLVLFASFKTKADMVKISPPSPSAKEPVYPGQFPEGTE